MMSNNNNNDIRWKQRFYNYQKALTKLGHAVALLNGQNEWSSEVDELLEEGLIQRFEYTQELAWNVGILNVSVK